MLRRAIVVAVLAFAASAHAEGSPPRLINQPASIRRHAELRRRLELKKHRLLERSMFEFTAPAGWTGAETKEDDDAVYKAAPDSTAGEPAMIASIGEGAVKLDDQFSAAQAKLFADLFHALHPDGSIKVIKKELVKIDGGEASRVIFETRVDGDKKTKPMREVDCVTTNEGHNADIHYVVPAASWSKVEKKLDESLKKTHVVPPADRKPKPLHPPEDVEP